MEGGVFWLIFLRKNSSRSIDHKAAAYTYFLNKASMLLARNRETLGKSAMAFTEAAQTRMISLGNQLAKKLSEIQNLSSFFSLYPHKSFMAKGKSHQC